jgi:predicted amidohydrolase YtcJ
VSDKVNDTPAGQWVQGVGWDEGKLAERRYIEAADLDTVSPNNPVWLKHTMGHYGVVNSVALELVGITAQTPDPPGGTIDRDADGNPTGILKESAMDLVVGVIPEFTPEQIDAAMEPGVRALNAEGITAIKDPWIEPKQWEAYQRALARDVLSIRVFTLWHSPDTVEEAEELVERIGQFTRPYISTGDDQLISGGIKDVSGWKRWCAYGLAA